MLRRLRRLHRRRQLRGTSQALRGIFDRDFTVNDERHHYYLVLFILLVLVLSMKHRSDSRVNRAMHEV